MTDLMTPPPEHDLPPSRAAQIRGAVLRSTAEPRPRLRTRPAVWLVVPIAAALAVLVVVGVRLDHPTSVVGAPSPTPAAATASLPAGSVETDAGALGDADARAMVAALDRPPDQAPAALADVIVARRLTTDLGDGTFVVWTTVDGSTWYVAEIPGEMKTSGPITGPAATEPPRLPDRDNPVTRLSELEMFGWTMDADRPDATARNLHSDQLYLTTPEVSRLEVRMTVEGQPGPWFSASVHEGYAFVPAVTMGPHSTTEDVDKVTTIEDRALDQDGAELPDPSAVSRQHHAPPEQADHAGRGVQGARRDRDEVGWLIRLATGEDCLRTRCVNDAQATDVDHQAGRVHAQTEVRVGLDLAHQLEQVVPDGWEVSTGCLWLPARSDGLLLHPGVVVHRALEPGGGLSAPPTLCVSITSGRLDHRSARPYARAGVDHYWHLDSRRGALEVFVRVGDEYRHAETITVSITSPGADDETVEWVDFGIGVLRLTLRRGPTVPICGKFIS